MRRVNLLFRTAVLLILLAVVLMLLPGDVARAESGKDFFNMSYIYFGSPLAYSKAAERTNGTLDDISPSYFDLNSDGTLKLNGIDSDNIESMHDQGLKVTPFLSNHWDRNSGKAALQNREKLAGQIVDAIAEYDLDGVNIDIENLTGSERDAYTDFVRILDQKLPSGKSLSVAVAPNPYGFESGWQASYDYAGLAKYSDYLMLMAYDQSYQGGEPGPVASGTFVEKSIKAALQNVPSEKIVLGIPFYGRYWKEGSDYGGYGISSYMVDRLVSKYSSTVIYDEAAHAAKAVITIKTTDVKPVVGGKTLGAGKYVIWYDNEDAVKHKLKLVSQYGLKGTGSWSLGQESDGTWDYYSIWLQGIYFTDVEGSWAQTEIMAVAKSGLMTGVSSSKFLPQGSLTRAEAAAVLVRSLGLGDNPGGDGSQKVNDPEGDSSADFTDISGHWAQKEIEIAASNGIVRGMGDGRFSPNQPVTRAQMASMLGRVYSRLFTVEETVAAADTAADTTANAGTDTAADTGSGETVSRGSGYRAIVFRDVSMINLPWAYDFIVSMADKGILNGYPDGSFRPSESVTRAQMAALMYRIDKM